jgi:hypothetical protein
MLVARRPMVGIVMIDTYFSGDRLLHGDHSARDDPVVPRRTLGATLTTRSNACGTARRTSRRDRGWLVLLIASIRNELDSDIREINLPKPREIDVPRTIERRRATDEAHRRELIITSVDRFRVNAVGETIPNSVVPMLVNLQELVCIIRRGPVREDKPALITRILVGFLEIVEENSIVARSRGDTPMLRRLERTAGTRAILDRRLKAGAKVEIGPTLGR